MILKQRVQKLLQGEFSRNIITMITGTALAQIILILANIVLARLYSPDEIGAYSYFITIVNMLGIMAALKYNDAIVVAKTNKEAFMLFKLSFIISLIVSVLVFLILILFKDLILKNIDYPVLNKYIIFIPFTVFLLTLITSYTYINNRSKNFKIIALTRVTQNLFMSVVQIVSYTYSVFGLIIGYIVGLSMALIHIYKKTVNKKYSYNTSKLCAVGGKYKDYALFYTPTALVNKMSYSLPILLLPILFNMTIVGHYSYSTLIVLGPMGIFTSSIQQVFYQKIASMHNAGENLFSYLKQTYKKIFLLGLLPHLLIFVFAPMAFRIVFGKEWETSGELTRYLMPWFFLIFLNSPVSSVYIIKNKQKQYFFMEIFVVLLRCIAILIGYYFFKSSKISIIFYGVIGFFYELLVMQYFFKITKK